MSKKAHSQSAIPAGKCEGEFSNEAREYHRAIQIFKEELDAINWYDHQLKLCRDPRLQEILAHNRDEEKGHAAKLFEWLEERDSAFSKELKKRLHFHGGIDEDSDQAA